MLKFVAYDVQVFQTHLLSPINCKLIRESVNFQVIRYASK